VKGENGIDRRPSAWRRFRRHRGALLALVVAGTMMGACLLSLPAALRRVDGEPGFNRQDTAAILRAPTWAHPCGTDMLGRDVLLRLLYGGAISLGIGLAAAAIAATIGVVWGMAAGYVGGRLDALLMRIVDVLYGLPYVLLIILLKVVFENALAERWGRPAANVVILFVAIGSLSWLTMARVVRGQVLSLKTWAFVEAARASGASAAYILRRHVLPNLAGPVLVYATLIVPQAILQESFLSFLGIGIAAPTPTWGSLAAEGTGVLSQVRLYWWVVLWPCAALGLTLLCLNFIGDGLRDALDPTAKVLGRKNGGQM
jgi:oligopeptide transport system permease protein